MENNIGLLLTRRAELNRDREAYVDSATRNRWTFGELETRTNQLGHSLVDAGVEKGDRVALLMMNSIEFLESYLALAKVGAVVVPLNWRLVADELEFILKDSGSTLCIYGEEFFELDNDLQGREDKTDIKRWLQVGGESPFADDYDDFRDAGSKELPPIRATDDDMLYIMYTSGTTGLPKGVMHTHETTLWALFSFSASANDRRNDDRNLNALPLFHVGALLPVTMNIYLGHTSVIMREFDPQLAWQLIDCLLYTSDAADE